MCQVLQNFYTGKIIKDRNKKLCFKLKSSLTNNYTHTHSGWYITLAHAFYTFCMTYEKIIGNLFLSIDTGKVASRPYMSVWNKTTLSVMWRQNRWWENVATKTVDWKTRGGGGTENHRRPVHATGSAAAVQNKTQLWSKLQLTTWRQMKGQETDSSLRKLGTNEFSQSTVQWK